ncbi:MAG: T9SS type A sorting domain-containing protein [Candidatus Latescibacteria bacterium]|nr:T9SS type A sorting domain-containing protein [Candidatus Latescibacterota bacterium]
MLALTAVLVLSASAATAQVFTEVAAQIGLTHQEMAAGAAWGDYDGDGDPDLFVTAGHIGVNRLYRNDAGVFTEVTGIAGDFGRDSSYGGAWADHDNDGDLDLFVARGALVLVPETVKNNLLLQNEGDATFTDIAQQAGVDDTTGRGTHAAWADYDQDGLIDLLVTNNTADPTDPDAPPTPFNRLFHNQGDDTYGDVFSDMGIQDWGVGAAWADYDDDGDPDLYVAFYWDGIDPVELEGIHLSRLYRNEGGLLTDIAPTTGLDSTGVDLGPAWGDFDNDGDLDLYINVNAPLDGTRPGLNYLFRNDDGGTFANIARQAGVADRKDFGLGETATWADYDNDGWLDLFTTNTASNPNRLFHNQGDGTFTDRADELGIDLIDAWSAAWADYDLDGDLDLYMPRLTFIDGIIADLPNAFYRNDSTGNHWLHIRLTGTASNRSAIGARVTAIAGDLRQLREVDGGSGLYSQNSLDLEFGFGQRTSIDSLIVRWPSGTVQVLTDLPTNQRLRLVEGESSPTAVAETDDATPSVALDQNYPNPFNAETVIAFALDQAAQIELTIVNQAGQTVRRLATGFYRPGAYRVQWDGTDAQGTDVASGVYVYRLTIDGQQAETIRLTLLR